MRCLKRIARIVTQAYFLKTWEYKLIKTVYSNSRTCFSFLFLSSLVTFLFGRLSTLFSNDVMNAFSLSFYEPLKQDNSYFLHNMSFFWTFTLLFFFFIGKLIPIIILLAQERQPRICFSWDEMAHIGYNHNTSKKLLFHNISESLREFPVQFSFSRPSDLRAFMPVFYEDNNLDNSVNLVSYYRPCVVLKQAIKCCHWWYMSGEITTVL